MKTFGSVVVTVEASILNESHNTVLSSGLTLIDFTSERALHSSKVRSERFGCFRYEILEEDILPFSIFLS